MIRAARHVLVRGRVQGVGYRISAREQALALKLDGWVRNLSDGHVETWIEGPIEQVEAMLTWLSEGPPPARVDELQVLEEAPDGLSGFEIRVDAHV